MQGFVRDYYTGAFPEDELGYEIAEGVTFQDIWDLFGHEQGGDAFYGLIGVGDSLVRERLFAELANRLECSYEMVYYAWLHGRDISL